MTEKKKKIIGPLELITLLLAIGLIGYIVLQNGGIGMMEKTEHIEIIDNPRQGETKKRVRKYEYKEDSEDVEAVLRQIANQYAGERINRKTEKKLEDAGMSKGEVNFLKGVQAKKRERPEMDSVDWLAVFNASRKTYAKVKSVFENAGIDVEETEDKVTSKIVNDVTANVFYSKLEEVFNISEADAKAFAQKGERALSDWARFVEENKE